MHFPTCCNLFSRLSKVAREPQQSNLSDYPRLAGNFRNVPVQLKKNTSNRKANGNCHRRRHCCRYQYCDVTARSTRAAETGTFKTSQTVNRVFQLSRNCCKLPARDNKTSVDCYVQRSGNFRKMPAKHTNPTFLILQLSGEFRKVPARLRTLTNVFANCLATFECYGRILGPTV